MLKQIHPAFHSGLMLDPAWTSKEQDSRRSPKAMSTKILGLGLFLVGVLIMSVALIIGLEFPKYVRTKLIDDQCILNKDHVKFDSWRRGTQWTRLNRLYFWVIENKQGFLYAGEEPRMRERGPYVYRESLEKTNVTFNVHEVLLNMRRTNVFDINLTFRECGHDCKETEQMTVISSEYLRKTTLAGSEQNYLISEIPKSVSVQLQTLGVEIPQNITDKLPAFGCLNATCDSHWSSLMTPTNGLLQLSFGAWLRQNDTSFKSVILFDRDEKSFSEEEMIGLYNVITTRSLLKSDNSSTVKVCSAWSQQACASRGSFLIEPKPECGVIPLLELFVKDGTTCHQNLSVLVQTFLCSDVNPEWCFMLPGSPSTVSAYIKTIATFIISHIASVVQETFLATVKKDLVITRNQSELAFGYYEDDPNSDSVFVPGAFTDPLSNLGSNDIPSSQWIQSTCLQDRNVNNNMMFRKLNGSNYVPKALLKSLDNNANLAGHTDYIATCGKLQACVACQPGNPSPKMFIPELWRSIYFTEPIQDTLFDTDVFKMHMVNTSFNYDGVYDVYNGLQNMSGVYGYTVWRSHPHLLFSTGYPEAMTSSASADKHLSYIHTEPDTGRVWQRAYRTQFNVGINPSNVNGNRFRPYNVTYLGRPVPLYWMERSTLISSDELGHFNHKVARLMRASCGGLIGISILAAIVFVISVVVCILQPKPNRVAPVADDSALVHHPR